MDLNPVDRERVFEDEIPADSQLEAWQKQQPIHAIYLFLNSFLPAPACSRTPWLDSGGLPAIL